MLITTKSVVVLLLIVVTIVMVSIPSVYGDFSDIVQQKYDESLYHVGINLTEGDVYEYKICSDDTIQQVIYPYHCYNIQLNFVTILESYKGKVWVVQGNFTTPEINRSMILLIDVDTFEVSTDRLNVDLGNSIQNTIFSLSQYGKSSLSIGTVWGIIPSYFTHDVPLEIKRHELIDTEIGEIDSVILGYDVVQPSNYYISNDFSFPVRGNILSPNIIFPEPIELFYFEIINFSNNSNYDSNYDVIQEPHFELNQDIVISVEDKSSN